MLLIILADQNLEKLLEFGLAELTSSVLECVRRDTGDCLPVYDERIWAEELI